MNIIELLKEQENELSELNKKYAELVTNKKENIKTVIDEMKKEFFASLKEKRKIENEKYVTEIKDTKREITRLNKSLNKLKEAYDIMQNNTSK
jgi:ClpP class serine protease